MADGSSSRRSFRNTTESSSHAAVHNLSFPFVFAVGSTAIVLCRLLTPSTSHPHLGASLAAAVAVAIIGLFGWYSVRRARKGGGGEEISRAGDDLYYLGLLFTLVSLIYALITLFIFHDRATGVSERTYELIGSFGIALLSTVAGILGRVILYGLQPTGREESSANRRPEVPELTHGRRWPHLRPRRPDVDAVLLKQHDLDHLLRKLLIEIRGAADAFSHYNRITMLEAQTTKRHAEHIGKDFSSKLRDETQAAVAQTEDAYRKLVATSEKTADAVERRVSETVDALAIVAEQFGSTARACASLSAGAERAQQAVLGLERSATAISETLGTKVSDLARACDTFARNVHEHQEITRQELEKTRATTVRATGSLHALVKHLEPLNRSLCELSANLERQASATRLPEAPATTVASPEAPAMTVASAEKDSGDPELDLVQEVHDEATLASPEDDRGR